MRYVFLIIFGLTNFILASDQTTKELLKIRTLEKINLNGSPYYVFTRLCDLISHDRDSKRYSSEN